MTLAVTSKTHAQDYTTASTFTTASITVPVGSIAVIVIAGYDTTNNGTKTPVLTSNALSGITNLSTGFDYATNGYWTSTYWGAGTGIAGTVSIPWGVAYEGCEWHILQVTPDAGNSVTVLQGVQAIDWASGSTPMTLTMGTLTSGAAIVSAEANYNDTSTVTPGSGYTELYDTDAGVERHHAQYRLDPVSTTVSATSAGGAQSWYMGAFEVIEVVAAPLGMLPVGF